MSRLRRAPQVLDYAGMPAVVVFLYRQLERLRREGYSTAKLGRVTLSNHLRGLRNIQDGESQEGWGEWRIRSSVNPKVRYPWKWEAMGVVCRDAREVHVATLGHEVLHYLVDTKQIEGFGGSTPKEREDREEAAADVEGREWLGRWRRGHRRRA